MSSELNSQKAVDACGLGQALFILKGDWAIIPEDGFRAIKKARNLPKASKFKEQLVVGLAAGLLSHKGTLVLMDFDYRVDEDGNLSRREIELQVLKKSYTAPADSWDLDRVDFYGSFLDLPEVPTAYRPVGGIDRPWARLKDIRVPLTDIRTLKNAPKMTRKNAGGRPPKIDWDEFWIAVILRLYLEPKPVDNDRDWAEMHKALRQLFVDEMDESSIRKKIQRLKMVLLDAGIIKQSAGSR